MNDPINPEQPSSGSPGYPPKPLVAERNNQNAVLRSLISLGIYALFFYFIFDRNVTYIAAILLVIIIHEMGHFLFMKLFNYSNVKIFIVPLLGAFTSGKKQQVSQWQLCLIILAGPVPGIIIGCILNYFNQSWHNETVTMLSLSFLAINLLNCLPFYPLDGGRLIETLFFRENYIIRLVLNSISIVALLVLTLFLLNPFMLIIPFLIGLDLYNENKLEKIREYLRHEKISYRMDYNSLPDRDYWLIRDCLLFSFQRKYRGVTPGRYEYSYAEPLLVQQINKLLQVNFKADLSAVKQLLVLLFYIFIFFGPIALLLLEHKK